MEFKKLCLNVGGKKFETTSETLQRCKRLYELINTNTSDGEHDCIFIDRDPDVFEKTLKFLRGYPIHDQLLNDNDLMHELIYWKHDLTYKELPECVKESIKAYIKYDESRSAHVVVSVNFKDIENPIPIINNNNDHTYFINTPDTYHFDKYKAFYYLVPKTIAVQLLGVTDAVLCNIVCSQGWNDHVWIHKDDIKMALYKLKLRLVLFSNNKWCVCDTECAS